MHLLSLRPHLLALAAALSTGALAAPDASHPAVVRALAHLAQADIAARAGTPEHTFDLRDLLIDADGTEHVRFARRYQGLRVIGGDLVVHSQAQGALKGISETLRSAPALSVQPQVDASSAMRTAAATFDAAVPNARRVGAPLDAERVLYARGGQARLAWDIKVPDARFPEATYEHVIVDGHSGKVLDRWSSMQTADVAATGVTQYSGTVALRADLQADGTYALRDLTRGGHETRDYQGKLMGSSQSVLVTAVTPDFGDGTHSKVNSNSTDAADAAYGHAMTWDFYKNVMGRNGIANDGVGATSKVHAGTGPFGILYNAGWSDACFCMSYTKMVDNENPALVSLDVAGHEMTHGVTSRTAGLIYSGESGGLNESMSDIMGNMVEGYARNPNDPADGDIGEQMFPTNPLRRMYVPSMDGASADCWYANVGALDVHYSSGVGNHFFYLLALGTAPKKQPASPTCQAGDTKVATGNGVLKGIGALPAAKIMYRALTTYMTSDTNYAAARTATLSAATDLYGATSRQARAVANAWSAVGVN